ncbi:MAG: radical SAM protein [Bacteroidales bacterium]|nr:radical SAM protein [Bacteroidales bacterium]
MLLNTIKYDEPVFRPPGEARSAIIQATLGCSWNKCAFCEMYTSKNFKSRNFEELKSEIETLSRYYKGAKKIFLADGNAFVLSANKLIPILDEINKQFGKLQRISSYALPKDIMIKSESELKDLRSRGLKLLYVGIETGDNELLKLINKGETFNSTVDGILKAHNAGIDTSIMILNGLGGKKYSQQHALKSAEIINKISPKFLSTLTLSLPYGVEHFQEKFNGEYQQQTIVELFEELKLFIENIKAENIIFRSNHVSNNLNLKGTLSKDNDQLVEMLQQAIINTPNNKYPSAPDML